jgi:hypothetical protein
VWCADSGGGGPGRWACLRSRPSPGRVFRVYFWVGSGGAQNFVLVRGLGGRSLGRWVRPRRRPFPGRVSRVCVLGRPPCANRVYLFLCLCFASFAKLARSQHAACAVLRRRPACTCVVLCSWARHLKSCCCQRCQVNLTDGAVREAAGAAHYAARTLPRLKGARNKCVGARGEWRARWSLRGGAFPPSRALPRSFRVRPLGMVLCCLV